MKLAVSNDERKPAVATAATDGWIICDKRKYTGKRVSRDISGEVYEACGREKRSSGHRSSVYVCSTLALADPRAYNGK